MQHACEICTWINELKNSSFLVKEFTTGYAVLSKYQYYKGYTLFLHKEHVTELHYLQFAQRKKFLIEMSLVGEAVYSVVKPDKLNYELLGNTVPHLHCHIIPRYKREREFNRPIWVVDKSIRQAHEADPESVEIKHIREAMRQYLKDK